MEELHFRIVIVPQEKYISDKDIEQRNNSYSARCQFLLESCGLKEITLNILKVKKQDEDDFPEVEGLVYQCQAKNPVSRHRSPREFYKGLCSKWKEVVTPSISPMLVLHENPCFIKKNKPRIRVDCKKFSFGVLPHNGKYYCTLSSQKHLPYNFVTVDFQHDLRKFKIVVGDMEISSSYNKIKNVFVNIDTNPREVYFALCDPPLVFREEIKRNRYGVYSINHRTLNYGLMNDHHKFGKSNVLMLSFADVKEADEIIDRIHFRCGDKPIHYAVIETTEKFFNPDPDCDLGHFGCTYLLTALLRRNFTMEAQATNLANQTAELRTHCQTNHESLEKALTLVLAALDSGTIVNFWHAVEKQFQYYLSNRDEIDYQHYVVPEKTKVIRRATLTPTRLLLWAPEVMLSNRVLRNYDSEFSLRVAFRDDDNSRLSFHARFATHEIFSNSIRTPMQDGVRIGDRTYEFLAWSNSQIRDHGIWMYARDGQGRTVRDIRAWMGDFSHIHSVPKYMARMGQCFSQTEDAIAVPLDPSHVRVEDDVKGGLDRSGKPYCFSDGVGKISVELAKKVHDALGHDKVCSAFQIRYGGCKGMLVIDPTLKDVDIVFRQSMKKFESPKNTRLEIAKTSAPISLLLNRPFITILNDLGVRHRTFLKLQEKVLRKLTDMLFEEDVASEFLSSKTPSGLFGYKNLSNSGVFLTTEPFFRSLLLALHRHHVEKIKNKANIPIDHSDGRNMLGVMDETGILNYGEVFVQYTKDLQFGETTRDTQVLQGEVLVTKNPCLLPGDVRKFRAVDIPQLHHIVDCIVFPRKGPRPHPNEMAGSDLDGDEYSVLWNPDLIFHQQNASPGHFPSAREITKTRIDDEDMINFLIEYIKNDQVGTIANSHLAHADNYGIYHSICIKIANKFSFAVDFAKTGHSENLDRDDRPEKHPDFMEKNYKESYKSKKALGKMYRIAKDYESENEYASSGFSYEDVKVDPDLQYPGWERYREDAIKSRNKFNTLLKTVLRNYGIQHESEAFSSAFTKLHCRFQERKDRDEIEKVVVRTIKRLSKSMYEEFLEEFNEMEDVQRIAEGMLQKASAWYIVTYSDKNTKFLSFPWTVSKILANVKVKRQNNSPSLGISPIIHNFNERIQYCVSKNLLPYPTETRELLNYNYVCDRSIVEHALRVLILWAEDEDIIERSGQGQGYLYLHVFIRLFMFVSERAEYVTRKPQPVAAIDKNKHYSAASLCVEFFKFCLTLRFYSSKLVNEVLPFPVYKYKKLSNQAVVAYHRFAVLGKFGNLYFDTQTEENRVEMKPIYIESKIFPMTTISTMEISKAENALRKFSSAEEVHLREIKQTKKVLVSATGTEHSLIKLKDLLRKKPAFLTHLFINGELPTENI